MKWREGERRGQAYTPRPRWVTGTNAAADTFDNAGRALWDTSARVYDAVDPGEVEALLRVERSA